MSDSDFNKPYQMDLLDLDERHYQPIPYQRNPFAISTLYLCPKCREWVGVYVEGEGWQTRKPECPNGHRQKWEAIK